MHVPILNYVFFFLVGSPQIYDFCFPNRLFKSHNYDIYTTEIVSSVFCFT